MKSLVIAEKPSVAKDLCKVLGKFEKHDEYFENDEYIVTSAVGHIVELCMPEDYDKRDAYWRLANLPIVPEKFKLKPIERTESKYKVIKKLIARKDVETLINACDAGREGELIFSYIYKLSKSKKPVKRLWMLSMTPAAIKQSFVNMREGVDMENLADAAECRSQADWLIGINCTRGVTKRLYGSRAGNVAGVGRVQTPTLAIVVEREKEIENFKPRDYWRVISNFDVKNGQYEGIYQKDDFKKGDDEHDRADRIWNEEDALKVVEAAERSPVAIVSEEKKKSRNAPQRLYDLTTLQREGNNRFGYSARRTLQIAQALYEKHKMITYPRTDSKALPEDYAPVCRETLLKIEGRLESLAEKVVNNNWINPGNKRIFNNAQVSDHFAIIPTGEKPKKLNEDEAKIYEMISQRFIAIFYPSAEFDVTTRISKVEEFSFKTEGKVLTVPGWMEVYGKDPLTLGREGETLPPITAEDGEPPKAKANDCISQAEETRPPARYSEATLLSAMEGAGKLVEDDEHAEAMKETGLGTPATRAAIIERLIAERYMEREQRYLIPMPKAETLLEFLSIVEAAELTKPELTGAWEHKLHKIEDGELKKDDFIKEIVTMTEGIVDRIKNYEESVEDMELTDLKSPYDDHKPLYESMRAYRTDDNDFAVYKIIGNRKMTKEEITQLLETKRIGPIDNFRSKNGKPYSAFIYLDDETKRVKFDFGNGENTEDIDFSELQPIANCPRTGGKVYETANNYLVRVEEKGEFKIPIKVSRKILDREIPSDQVLKLLEHGKTDLIDKFWSKKTRRPFDAYLVLKDNNRTGFEFPPREPKKKVAKKAKKKTARKAAKKVAKKAVKKAESSATSS
ncbi:DNA topoisomerase III [Puniceicoccaceae bacterium K14]|nr:DNA topoisomerase III [Puniceicoccaceae bacterium K14]